jgi:hypothetical protein
LRLDISGLLTFWLQTNFLEETTVNDEQKTPERGGVVFAHKIKNFFLQDELLPMPLVLLDAWSR